jgi:hypothetical protein
VKQNLEEVFIPIYLELSKNINSLNDPSTSSLYENYDPYEQTGLIDSVWKEINTEYSVFVLQPPLRKQIDSFYWEYNEYLGSLREPENEVTKILNKKFNTVFLRSIDEPYKINEHNNYREYEFANTFRRYYIKVNFEYSMIIGKNPIELEKSKNGLIKDSDFKISFEGSIKDENGYGYETKRKKIDLDYINMKKQFDDYLSDVQNEINSMKTIQEIRNKHNVLLKEGKEITEKLKSYIELHYPVSNLK